MVLTTITLRAIQIAEEILGKIVDLEDEDLEKALDVLSTADATWGLLWGNPISKVSRMDADYYELKREVLQFAQKIRNSKKFPLAVLVEARRKHDANL